MYIYEHDWQASFSMLAVCSLYRPESHVFFLYFVIYSLCFLSSILLGSSSTIIKYHQQWQFGYASFQQYVKIMWINRNEWRNKWEFNNCFDFYCNRLILKPVKLDCLCWSLKHVAHALHGGFEKSLDNKVVHCTHYDTSYDVFDIVWRLCGHLLTK